MILLFNRLLFTSVLLLFASLSHADAVVTNIQSTADLVKSLQAGEHIIYMRHGTTVHKDKKRSKKLVDLSDCETQRNLSEEGRAQVKRLGRVIKSLNISIGKVKSSPYCRAKDTAKAVFGNFEIDQNLAFSIGKVEEESAKLGKYLFDSILSANNSKGNTVFVGHTANLKDGLGVWPKPEGVAVIFKSEKGQIIYKGMIKPDKWPVQ